MFSSSLSNTVALDFPFGFAGDWSTSESSSEMESLGAFFLAARGCFLAGAFLAAGALRHQLGPSNMGRAHTFVAFELEAAAFFAGAAFLTTLEGATKSSEPLSSAMRNPSLSLSDILSGCKALN
jgi:hypothetical protein